MGQEEIIVKKKPITEKERKWQRLKSKRWFGLQAVMSRCKVRASFIPGPCWFLACSGTLPLDQVESWRWGCLYFHKFIKDPESGGIHKDHWVQLFILHRETWNLNRVSKCIDQMLLEYSLGLGQWPILWGVSFCARSPSQERNFSSHPVQAPSGATLSHFLVFYHQTLGKRDQHLPLCSTPWGVADSNVDAIQSPLF